MYKRQKPAFFIHIIKFLELINDKKTGEEKGLEMLLNQKEILLQEMKEKEETLSFLNYKIDLYKNKIKEKKQLI